MVARRETPDILSDVLGNKPLPQITSTKLSKLSTPEHHDSVKSANQQLTVPAFKPSVDEDNDKVKVTFYISSDAVESLENAWLSLRKMAKQKTGRNTSKSKIVEAAIRIAAQDVVDKGERSQFVDTLVKQ